MMARSAAIAAAKLAAGGGDEKFYRAKLQSARFYAEHLLPQSLGLLRIIKSGGASVADAEGLSYYSDASLMRRLKMDPLGLSASRQQLVQAGLLAYEKPFYQVLSLEPAEAPRSGPISVGELLRQALGGQP